MFWERLTTQEINLLDRSLPVILNLAAIEQHGPHLPVNTDAVIGQHLLRSLDRAKPEAQLILPQVKVCCSEHHLDYPGTLSVRHTVLLDYASGILDSVVHAGFRKLLILNSHGGNQAISQVILEHFGAKHLNCCVALATWWDLASDQLQAVSETGRFGAGHACELETSVMMAAGAIDEDQTLPEGLHYARSFDWADGSMLHGSRATLYRSMRAISCGTGIVGRPDAASLAKGQRITDVVVEKLAAVVSDLAAAVPEHASTSD